MKFSNLIGPCIAVALSLPLASASAVITPRQKSVESWVGPITPSLQACLDSQPCTRSAYIWEQCLNCMPGHDSSYNSFQCFCGGIGGSVSTVPLNFRTEWLGGAGMGLPYQCAQCLEKVLPAATSAASDVAAITVNYCYLPPRSPTVPDFGPIHQLMGFAENSTFTNKLPVTLLNFTVATKTPWTIPADFAGFWNATQPWPKD